jgi:hypothetical protein
MDTPFLRAQHYHDQAANLRKLASEQDDLEHRKALLETADSYENLALNLLQKASAVLKGQA